MKRFSHILQKRVIDLMMDLRFKLGLLFLLHGLAGSLAAQSWEYAKEQDGIKIYTRKEAGKPLKEFRGIATIKAPVERVFSVIEDGNHNDWWDENLILVKVLAYEKNKRAKYYLVFDSPWPVSNRELYADVTVVMDQAKRVYTVTSVALKTGAPSDGELVRIRDYRQSWIISPAGENSTQVVLEGYIDPAGSVPAWISNMIIVQSPFSSILGLRRKIENR